MRSSSPGFPSLGTVGILGWRTPLAGAALCSAGCPANPTASTHKMPAALPAQPSVTTKNVSGQCQMFPGGQTRPRRRTSAVEPHLAGVPEEKRENRERQHLKRQRLTSSQNLLDTICTQIHIKQDK